MSNIADEFADIKASMDKIRAERMTAISGEPEKAADVPAEPVEINHYPAPTNPGWANIYDTAPSDYMGWTVYGLTPPVADPLGPSVTIREVADDA